MKRRTKPCPLAEPGKSESCPLEPRSSAKGATAEPAVVIVRSERRSWITLAITGFGALLLRYLKTARERVSTAKKK